MSICVILIKNIKILSNDDFIIWFKNKSLNNLNLTVNEIIFNNAADENFKKTYLVLFERLFNMKFERYYCVEKAKKELIANISLKYKLFKITLYFNDRIFNWKKLKVELICKEKTLYYDFIDCYDKPLTIINLEFELLFFSFNILKDGLLKLKFNGYQYYDINFNENEVMNSHNFQDCDISVFE